MLIAIVAEVIIGTTSSYFVSISGGSFTLLSTKSDEKSGSDNATLVQSRSSARNFPTGG